RGGVSCRLLDGGQSNSMKRCVAFSLMRPIIHRELCNVKHRSRQARLSTVKKTTRHSTTLGPIISGEGWASGMRVRHLLVGILIAYSALSTSSSSFYLRSDRTVAYAQLSLSFEPNRGQTDPDAQFIARGPGYALRLAPLRATLALNGDTLTLSLLGAN